MRDWDNSRPFEAQVTRCQHHDCQQQGRLFETAFLEKYDMRVFVPTFMKSTAAAGLDAEYNRYQWAGNAYILEDVSSTYGIGPVRRPDGQVGEPLDGADFEACFWMGYLYRWWHYYTKQSSREIYACADYETMCRSYPGYHTLSCTMAVDRLMENLPDPGPQSTWGSREAFEKFRGKSEESRILETEE